MNPLPWLSPGVKAFADAASLIAGAIGSKFPSPHNKYKFVGVFLLYSDTFTTKLYGSGNSAPRPFVITVLKYPTTECGVASLQNY